MVGVVVTQNTGNRIAVFMPGHMGGCDTLEAADGGVLGRSRNQKNCRDKHAVRMWMTLCACVLVCDACWCVLVH